VALPVRYALLDANNFYASAERVWRPSLIGRPVAILSNNDGAVIARSNEAKALGIAMGEPWFQVRKRLPDAGIIALSANFALYGEMSNRMMAIAAGMCPRTEPYSIDEVFQDLTCMPGDHTALSKVLRERVLQWLGIPCGVGVGGTKTLAKLANFVAKSADRKPGSYPAEFARVCNLAALPASDLDAVFAATELGEVWGIGPRIGAQLREAGLKTVLDVVQLDPAMVRRKWSVVLERTVRELQGEPCIAFEDMPASKKEIAFTRSFGHTVTTLSDLTEAVSNFASRVAEKLRKQGSCAGQVLVFVHTSHFRRDDKQLSRAITVPLRRPSADSASIVQAAVHGLQAIYRPGYNFAKAGVMLLDLQDESVHQHELALEPDEPVQRGTLMQTMDKLNERYGRGTISLASAGPQGGTRAWSMRQDLKTPNYTAGWNDLPRALA
jgi:DNA polymerase V